MKAPPGDTPVFAESASDCGRDFRSKRAGSRFKSNRLILVACAAPLTATPAFSSPAQSLDSGSPVGRVGAI